MVQYAQDKGLKIDKSIMSAFEKALSTKTTREYWDFEAAAGVGGELSLSASIPKFLSAIVKITSSLKMASGFNEDLRREFKPKTRDIRHSRRLFKGAGVVRQGFSNKRKSVRQGTSVNFGNI
jgi:hypothetical protein